MFQTPNMRHHWVHRRRQDGKCRQCGKVSARLIKYETCNHPESIYGLISLFPQGFQQKFSFHSKDIVAISCSWCKQAVSVAHLIKSVFKNGCNVHYRSKCLTFIQQGCIKGLVHPKMKILSLITHPHVVPNTTKIFLMESESSLTLHRQQRNCNVSRSRNVVRTSVKQSR